MDLTVLVDNNTFIDQYYLGEPAVSYLLETDGKKILFDVGYSDVFLKNMEAMGYQLDEMDAIILSHGHNDHTGGLSYLIQEKKHLQSKEHIRKKEESIQEKKGNQYKKPLLIAHPGVFEEKQADGISISAEVSPEQLSEICEVKLTKSVYQITENLYFLGQIPRKNSYEAKSSVGIKKTINGWEPDFVEEDTALVFTGEEGIYIITGCSHAGICNIVEYAKEVTGQTVIKGIIGGFHLFDVNESVHKTIAYMKRHHIPHLYPCHCTSLRVKAEFLKEMEINESGSGLKLHWE